MWVPRTSGVAFSVRGTCARSRSLSSGQNSGGFGRNAARSPQFPLGGDIKNYPRLEFGSMNAVESNLSRQDLLSLGTERRSNQDHADRQDVGLVRANLTLPKGGNSPIEGRKIPRGRHSCTPRAGAIRCPHECQ